MFEAGSIFGFAVGIGCGLCIGWLMKGKYRSKAVSLAADTNMVSSTATYYRSTISSMFSAACRTAIFRCIVAFFVRVVEATTGPTADIFAHLCLKQHVTLHQPEVPKP